jgi:hypothetical protein
MCRLQVRFKKKRRGGYSAIHFDAKGPTREFVRHRSADWFNTLGIDSDLLLFLYQL